MPGLVCAGEGQPLGAQAISKDWKPWQLDSLPWFPSLCQLLRHYPNVSLGISWLLAGSGVPTLHRHTNHCPRMAVLLQVHRSPCYTLVCVHHKSGSESNQCGCDFPCRGWEVSRG